ncbi:MAG: 30S ribosomal protein S17e [Nanoarchaeota archaeon]
MGRIKTTLLKRKTIDLYRKHGDKFSADFSSNKATTANYVTFSSKKQRNIIAGYMTRLKKKEKEAEPILLQGTVT